MITNKINKELQDRHRLLMTTLMIFIVVILGLVSVAIYLLFYPPEQIFLNVVVNEQGKTVLAKSGQPVIKRMVPQEKPVTTRAALLQWATLAVTSINNFSASNYQTRLDDNLNTFFTEDGAQSFRDELDRSGILDRIIADKLILTSVVTDTPVLLKQGMLPYGFLNNKYTWKIQVPLLVTYQLASTSLTVEKRKFIVTLTVVEMPTWESKNGIGIQQYTASKR